MPTKEMLVIDEHTNDSVVLLCPNGSFVVVDPYLINVDDLMVELESPDCIRTVRVRRPGWGVKDVVRTAIAVHTPLYSDYYNDLC